jgi:hypothetical protein
MKFTYYTIIGRDINMLKGHVQNIKEYAGFDRLPCDKEFLVIVYKNQNIPESKTQEILTFCKEQNIRTHVYEEPTSNFIENLYACWNLGYEIATDGYVFRGGSDQIFSKDSFISLYEVAEKIRKELPDEKVTLQANTIECASRLRMIGAQSRHFAVDFGYTYEGFDYTGFENFCNSINSNVKQKVLDIGLALQYWRHPTPLGTTLGMVNRTDGCSWLMTKDEWVKYGPIPVFEQGITGDVVIHDRLQLAGYNNYIVRDCITYHFVQGESKQ